MPGTTIRPFLMFEGKAEEAMSLYVSLFPESRIESIDSINRYEPNEPGPEGTAQLATASAPCLAFSSRSISGQAHSHQAERKGGRAFPCGTSH